MYLINHHRSAPERSRGAAKARSGQRPLPFSSHQELEEFIWSQVPSWAWPEPATGPKSTASPTLQQRRPRGANLNKVITLSLTRGRNNKNVLRRQEENQLRHQERLSECQDLFWGRKQLFSVTRAAAQLGLQGISMPS